MNLERRLVIPNIVRASHLNICSCVCIGIDIVLVNRRMPIQRFIFCYVASLFFDGCVDKSLIVRFGAGDLSTVEGVNMIRQTSFGNDRICPDMPDRQTTTIVDIERIKFSVTGKEAKSPTATKTTKSQRIPSSPIIGAYKTLHKIILHLQIHLDTSRLNGTWSREEG